MRLGTVCGGNARPNLVLYLGADFPAPREFREGINQLAFVCNSSVLHRLTTSCLHPATSTVCTLLTQAFIRSALSRHAITVI